MCGTISTRWRGGSDGQSGPSAPRFLHALDHTFCAPVFVFLAGTSRLMTSRKTPSAWARSVQARRVVIVIEWFVVATAGALRRGESSSSMARRRGDASDLGDRARAWSSWRARSSLDSGLPHHRSAILVGHNLLDPIWPATSGVFDHRPSIVGGVARPMAIASGPFSFVGVHASAMDRRDVVGYGAAPLFQNGERRSAAMPPSRLGHGDDGGVCCTQGTGVYGDTNSWQVQDGTIATLIDFLNVTKYPPSLLFMLMTLGPAAILCASADRMPSAIKRPLIVFGRAPFAFYVAHLYLIHTLAVAFGVVQGFDAREFLTYAFFFPKGYGVGLPGVYVVWLLVVATLYPLCNG